MVSVKKAESVFQKSAPSSYQGTEKRPSNQAWNVQLAFWKQLWHVCTGFFPPAIDNGEGGKENCN